MAPVIRLLPRDEYATAARFIGASWQNNHVYCREPRLFDWTFGQNPHWDDDAHYSFAIAEDDGETIGMLGIIPFALNRHGQTQPACWLVNWKVREDRRSSGAGLGMLKLFRDRGLVTVSFGINDIIARLYRGLRWETIENIPRLLRILPDRGDRLRRLCRLCDANLTDEDFRRLIGVGAQDDSAWGGAAIPLGPDVADDWNRRGWRPYASMTIGCARDFRHLQWRYLQHPLYSYQSALIADGDRLGLAVWRVEIIRRRTPEGLEPIDRIVRLVEFLPTSTVNARALLAEVDKDAHARDAFGIDFYGFHHGINQCLEENGFVSLDRLPFGNRLPSRFQPLDNKGGVITSALKVGFPGPVYGTPSDWYWTRADSDQDRPN
jgi:hypothetical protein